MLKSILVGAMLVCSANAAFAQWVMQRYGGEFDESPTYIALTAMPGGYALGFRCNENELKIVLVTPEEVDDDDTLRLMNLASPKLRLRVDGGAIISLDAELHEAKGDLTVLADVDDALVRSVASARSKVSVVLTVIGQNFHEKSFGVRGSSAAIGSLLSKCDLKG